MKESIPSAGFCLRQFFLLIAQVMHYMGKKVRGKKSALGMFSSFFTVEMDISSLRDFRVFHSGRSSIPVAGDRNTIHISFLFGTVRFGRLAGDQSLSYVEAICRSGVSGMVSCVS